MEAVRLADVAITSLAGDDAVREVALGQPGIRDAISTGIYVDASTVSPTLTAELDEAFDRFAALPVLGAPQAVEGGEAIYLAGGDPEVLESLAPVFDSLGGRLKRYRRPELATAGKLAVNLLLLSGIATVAEALAVGRAGGLTDTELTDLLSDSPMLASGLQNRLQAVVEGSGPAWWTTTLAAKDARLASEVGTAAGKRLRLAHTLVEAYQEAADAGHQDEDMAAVATLY
jgi:3-hydroxyisobutyrate dehydrogenase-like beta-hydroxyacid dehydrogenase